ncbi:DUF3592 domain-containing protein [Acetobacter conturbans]|uniref:DUF3592 domain-containing protein n=1 Tax=Acetobacter conturbans TaxID=1737472 RepID=A0ABX0K8C3_9PROT|nr:DUF3592 domain-containing protein [Acetobacter conturbans]NHN89649.1 hypothetical protein [Acetobacter conturbans]
MTAGGFQRQINGGVRLFSHFFGPKHKPDPGRLTALSWSSPNELNGPRPRNVVSRRVNKDAGWALGAMLLVGLIPIAGLLCGEYFSLNHWQKSAKTATGRVEHAQLVSDRGHRRCLLNYVFSTVDGKTVHGKQSQSLTSTCRERVGEAVIIIYLPANPEENQLNFDIAHRKTQFIEVLASLIGISGFVTAGSLYLTILMWRKERKLLAWGNATAGLVTYSRIVWKNKARHLKIWCAYADQDGRVRMIRPTFPLINLPDQGNDTLRKLRQNATVIYDPEKPRSALLYPSEMFKISLRLPPAHAPRSVPMPGSPRIEKPPQPQGKHEAAIKTVFHTGQEE